MVVDEPAAAIGENGGRLIKHARYYWLRLAESHLTRRLFASMLGRIDGLPLPSERGGWEPMALSKQSVCSVAPKWVYTFDCWEAPKFIPGKS